MWFVYALSAAIVWGVSYAASGKVIERGMPPLVFFTLYACAAAAMGFCVLIATGKLRSLLSMEYLSSNDTLWLVIAVTASGIGTLLIYLAIGEKNATLASLIEISYPLFVAFFAWLFFRDVQVNLFTGMGAVLIMGGVAIVYLSNRA